jgi:sensor histidine kinase YesM
MKWIKGEATVRQLELLVWTAVFIVVFFTLLPEDGLAQSFFFAVINVFFYALIIYGNINLLYPALYLTGRLTIYIISSALILLIIGVTRCYAIMLFHNTFFPVPEKITLVRLASFVFGGVLIFILSFVFRIALAYFTIKKQSEQILLQKSQAELGLLKSQVQPHFLFNTLNNINYILHKEAPETAILIERLAAIMRYFIDESPKDKVTIATEVKFLENYIELERIRIRYQTEIRFTKEYNDNDLVPPMLLMTFVENIFKHGIDKSAANTITLSLILDDSYLSFSTMNRVNRNENPGNGFGLHNLRQRLTLLFGSGFYLHTEENGGLYTAFLKIPLR